MIYGRNKALIVHNAEDCIIKEIRQIIITDKYHKEGLFFYDYANKKNGGV